MHQSAAGSGGSRARGGSYQRIASPPPPNQTVPLGSGITSPEPHLTHSPPSFPQQQQTSTHPLQQFLMGAPLQGLNINLASRHGGQPVLQTRISPSAAVPPEVLPVQTDSTSPMGFQHQQLSPQAMARQQLHPSTQAFLQMSCLQGQAISPASGAATSPPLQRPVLNVPLSPGHSFSVDPATGIPVQQVNISASSSVQQHQTSNPFVFQDVHKSFPDSGESSISQESLVQNLLMPSHQPMGTIHHHGQGSPGRSSMPPLSSPASSGSPRRSSSHSPTRGAPGHKSPTGGGYKRPHSPARTSPLPSSPSLVMRKIMMPQSEERPPANAEVTELRRQVLQERLSDLKRLEDNYNDILTELFFLQNGGNMMDFLAWKKRPNQELFVYLSSQRMDDEEEKTINDEVKVITNSGSNIPVGTPVAISTQLPPALFSQLNQKAREQKAREMRRSLPGTVQAAAAAAAGSAAAAGDGEASRKRSFAQAGLDSGGGQDKKVQLMQSSSHEPNVTVTPSMMTAIPSLPGASDILNRQQQQQSATLQQQQHRVHAEPSTPTRHPGATALALARSTQQSKSPPATYSLHQLKFPSPSSAGSSPATSSTQGTPTAARKTPTLSSGTTPIAGASTTTTPSPNRTASLKPTPLSPTAQQWLATRQKSLSAVYDYTIGSREMIVEKAKQEVQVMQRIAELRKEGLWAAKRLPKVQEPPRQKTHWDYLLEEMQWLATDFAQERRWKRASARKLVRAVARHHQEQHAKEVKTERKESQKLKKIAANIAKEIMTFWDNIEKVVQYKQQSRLEERRKKVMDLQLDYIVGQTEKYSSWLTEGLNLAPSSTSTSIQGSIPSSPRSEGDTSVITGDDVDFQPVGDDSDDEETIDVEEKADEADADARAKEIELLQKESELPLKDLLSTLPPGILDKPGSSSEVVEKEDGRSARRKADKDETSLKIVTEDVKDEAEGKQDEEFVLSADEEDKKAQDEEETLEEQEAAEGTVDHKAEIEELEAEGELPIEELMKRYAGAYEDEYKYPRSEDDDDEEEEESLDDTETEEEEEEGTDGEEEELADIGMEYLIHPEKVAEEPKPSKQNGKGEPNKEITDIAAAAQSLQPTGYTLCTTQVKTKVPFLLRHKLREYQHIGLDWMVTLHEKKLNGILADEMGLGKTIQTIALLAHLACEEENWGPHLIIVPTSVMLNWEMELKKWCPGFKILTYYGNQKERKQKRQGWTKSNAFHVCITSYKLVIQDHQSFRRKKWKYLVLDEAQNIKNFKSQRWQTLLNFNSQRRLLLTGTPLQNNLMELWSLMHFLMPHVFASHREFREWFSNPLSGMIEGMQEYNEGLIRRLHKVLRPFLLRRLKSEVEKQLPQKYEHVVRCRLSKRQRFLYEDFMSRARTKETLASGHFMSVINVLMQLRKVCNHPDLFEARPIFSPFQMEGINFYTASLALKALDYDPFKHVNLYALNLCIADIESFLPAYAAHRLRKLQTPRKLIEMIDSSADTPPRLPKLKVKPGKLFTPVPAAVAVQPKEGSASPLILASDHASPMQQGSASPVLIRTQQQGGSGRSSPVVTQLLVRSPSGGTQLLRQTNTPPGTPGLAGLPTLQLTGTSTPGTFTLVSSQSPVVPGATQLQQLPSYTGGNTITNSTGSATSLASVVQQRLVLQHQIGTLAGSPNRAQFVTSQPITLQLQNRAGQQGARIAIPAPQLQLQSQSGGIVRIVQTSSGQQIVRQTPQASVISQQTLLQQQQLLQLRQQQQQRQLQQQQQQQVALQSVASGQQVAVNSQQLVNSVAIPVRAQAAGQPAVNQVTATTPAAAATPQLTRVQQPQLSAVAQVQSALQQQQQQQQFLQQLQQQQLKLQQNAAGQTSAVQTTPQVVASSSSAGQVQTVVTTASSSVVNQTQKELKPVVQSIPKLQTVATTSGARTTTTPSKTYSTAAAWKAKREAEKKLPFYLESVTSRLDDDRKDTLSRIATINQRRCLAKPVYGQDLFSAVSIYSGAPPAGGANPLASGIGHVFTQCVRLLGSSGKGQYQYTDALRQLIRSPEDMLIDLEEIIKRYAIVIPLAEAPPITLHTSHPPPSFLTDQKYMVNSLQHAMKPKMKCLHQLQMAAKLQFPELRLIQYDCGKLQALSVLLHKLKMGSHRVLIFTQMTKMLDVLERFLNYYGYIYLRLDGATRVEMRQVLMERFNQDPRIFVFILSTRSGGIGVNLTGADTVIFYDSDWNPTMDAQAQDRCHRIGQTRDVHIYRLVSEMTVEENILKKANQKRLLVDVSIEGGNFTTAFFRERTIKELFDLSTTGNMGHATELVVEDLKAMGTPDATPPQVEAAPSTPATAAKNDNLTKEQLEQALARTEDETDVQAASKAHAEQDAELAEFDEDIPLYEGEEAKKGAEPSKLEIELAQLDDQLTPIEKYAMKFLENTLEPVALQELKETEEQIKEAKKDWELSRLKAIKEEEERRAELEEDEILYTYAREDAKNKVLKNKQAKSKKNRASNKSDRSSVSNTPTTERRATRSTEPRVSSTELRVSTRLTRSNASSPVYASSPVLRSRNASPERPSRITSPTRSVPGSPTRTKVASPETSITLRSDRSRLKSPKEPLSPPLPSPSVSGTTTRSQRLSSSSVASSNPKSPPYIAEPTHGWSTRSKRKSVDIEFIDIREVEKRAKEQKAAAVAAAAAEKVIEEPKQPAQVGIGRVEKSKIEGDRKAKQVNSNQDASHDETPESNLENIQKLTATLENELKSKPKEPLSPPLPSPSVSGTTTRSRRLSSSSVASSNPKSPPYIAEPTHGWSTRSKRKSVDIEFIDIREVEKRAKEQKAAAVAAAAAEKVIEEPKQPAQVGRVEKSKIEGDRKAKQVNSNQDASHDETPESNLENIQKLTATLENELKSKPEKVVKQMLPQSQLLDGKDSNTVILNVPKVQLARITSAKPGTEEEPMDLCVTPSNGQPIDLTVKAGERPRTPILEKLQSESPSGSPKMPSSPKPTVIEEPNVFERMRFPAPKAVRQLVAPAQPLPRKPVMGERLELFDKSKSTFALRASSVLNPTSKEQPSATNAVVAQQSGASIESALQLADTIVSEKRTLEAEVKPSSSQQVDVDGEGPAVRCTQEVKHVDSLEKAVESSVQPPAGPQQVDLDIKVPAVTHTQTKQVDWQQKFLESLAQPHVDDSIEQVDNTVSQKTDQPAVTCTQEMKRVDSQERAVKSLSQPPAGESIQQVHDSVSQKTVQPLVEEIKEVHLQEKAVESSVQPPACDSLQQVDDSLSQKTVQPTVTSTQDIKQVVSQEMTIESSAQPAACVSIQQVDDSMSQKTGLPAVTHTQEMKPVDSQEKVEALPAPAPDVDESMQLVDDGSVSQKTVQPVVTSTQEVEQEESQEKAVKSQTLPPAVESMQVDDGLLQETVQPQVAGTQEMKRMDSQEKAVESLVPPPDVESMQVDESVSQKSDQHAVARTQEMKSVDSQEKVVESLVQPPVVESTVDDSVSQKTIQESHEKDQLSPDKPLDVSKSPVVEEPSSAKTDELSNPMQSEAAVVQADSNKELCPTADAIEEKPLSVNNNNKVEEKTVSNEVLVGNNSEREIPMDMDQPVPAAVLQENTSAVQQNRVSTPTSTSHQLPGPISVDIGPQAVSTPESTSAVARLRMVQALSPSTGHTLALNRSKSPSPERSRMYDVPKAAQLLSDSPTPENPLSSAGESPKFPNHTKLVEVASTNSELSNDVRNDGDSVEEPKQQNVESVPATEKEMDNEAQKKIVKNQDNEEIEKETELEQKEAEVPLPVVSEANEGDDEPAKEQIPAKEPGNGVKEKQQLQMNEAIEGNAESSKEQVPTIEPKKHGEDNQDPLHLDVNDLAAPSLVKQSPSSRSEIQEDQEREMPQIFPMITPPTNEKQQSPSSRSEIQEDQEREMPQIFPVITPPTNEKQQSPSSRSEIQEDQEREMPQISPMITPPTNEKQIRSVETHVSAEKMPKMDSLSPVKDVKDIPDDKLNNGEDKEKVSIDAKKTSADANHVDEDKEDDNEASSSNDESSESEKEDAPRTTRAKAALIAAQQRRQLRSEGRGALLQPVSFKPTVHKGKVVRSRGAGRRSSQSTASHSDSFPPPRKRGQPSKSPASARDDSDSSPQRSPRSPNQRGRPRKYPRTDSKSPRDAASKSPRVNSSRIGRDVESNSDSSAQGSSRSSRRLRNYSSPDHSSTSIDNKPARTWSRSVAMEIKRSARTRSLHNSSTRSHTSSHSSSAANPRDSSPARGPEKKVKSKQRRLSDRVRSTRS